MHLPVTTFAGYLGALLLFLGLTACDQRPAAGPARGGEQMLPAAERARYVVVGRLEDRERIDTHGYASHLAVEHGLLSTTPPRRLRIAWEELARNREPRFKAGDLILVALTPLPSASLWDRRFPGARAAASVLAVAAGGEAYMHNPDAQSLDLLARYLHLAAGQRERARGVALLAQMAVAAAPGLATSAVQRLSLVADLGNSPEKALRPLGGVLEDEQRPLPLRRAVVELIGARKIHSLRPRLDALGDPGSALQAPALAAIAALDGGIEAQRAAELLSSSDPAVRAIAVRYAAGTEIEQRLRRLIKDDPAPEVRGAAAASLVRRQGLEAFDDIVPALADDDVKVRLAAVEAVGELGAAAVPSLGALARDGSLDEATGAILALDQCGAEGREVLIRLAADHPDERVRNVALLALGKLGGHEH